MTTQQMKSVDIRTIDPNTLLDAANINVDIELPKIERMLSVAKRMGNNLYCFKVGDIVVKIGYSKTATATVDDRVESWMRTI